MGSNVRVSVVVEVETGSWDDDCSLGQARRQACENAVGKLRRLFEQDKNVRIVGPLETTVILVNGEIERPR